MTSRDFCYWLQGYFEILNATSNRDTNEGNLTSGQVECIRNHLAMVFKHEIDPSFGDAKHQYELARAHRGDVVDAAVKPPSSGPGSHSIVDAIIKC